MISGPMPSPRITAMVLLMGIGQLRNFGGALYAEGTGPRAEKIRAFMAAALVIRSGRQEAGNPRRERRRRSTRDDSGPLLLPSASVLSPVSPPACRESP